MAAVTSGSSSALPPPTAPRTIPGLITQAKPSHATKRSRKKKVNTTSGAEESPLISDNALPVASAPDAPAASHEGAPASHEVPRHPAAAGLGLDLDLAGSTVHVAAVNGHNHEHGGDLPSKPVSPVNQVLKRIKALKKKIQRIDGYHSSNQALNEDQKRAISSLPALNSTVKELQDLLQVLEDDEKADELRIQAIRFEEETKIKARVEVAVSTQKKLSETDITMLLQFLHLYSLVTSAANVSNQELVPQPIPLIESLTAQETAAIHALFYELANGPILGGGEDAMQRIQYIREGKETEIVSGVTYYRIKEMILGLTASPAEVAATKHGSDSDPSDVSDMTAGGPQFIQPSELPSDEMVAPEGIESTQPAASREPIDIVTPTPQVGGAAEGVPASNRTWGDDEPTQEFGTAGKTLDWAADAESGCGLPPIDGAGGAVEPEASGMRSVDGTPGRGGRGGPPRGRGRGGRSGYRGDGGFRGGERGGRGWRGDYSDTWRAPREGGNGPREGGGRGSRGRDEGVRGSRGGPGRGRGPPPPPF